jgi:hypothetical protein
MSSEDAEYYRRRSIEETELAYAATDERAARCHAELALRYQSREEQAEGRPPSEIPMPNLLELNASLGVRWEIKRVPTQKR